MSLNLQLVPVEVLTAARRIFSAGGRAFLVGGAVVDLVLAQAHPDIPQMAPKDWDIEVFGLDYSQIASLFGETDRYNGDSTHFCKRVGASFGILKLVVDGVEIDLNVPRRDNKIGKGHSDFVVEFDPTMSVKEASRRRDFTINTLAVALETGDVVDEWGGLADLEEGVLRATDPVLFVEDPLRALRAMQLLPRKAKTIEPATMQLIKGMHSEFPHLAKERVHEEWRKLLLRATRPSVGLEFLRESGWISWFPEIEALINCGQHPDWHPEGDVWVHSALAADAAAQMRGFIPDHQREAFVFGVFLHDVGKPLTTITPEMVANDEAPKDLLWTARRHDEEGPDPAESFLRRMTDNKKLIKLVRGIVRQHMQPYHLSAGEAKKGAYARLAGKMEKAGGDLRLIGRMCQCDACATSLNWKTRSLVTGEPNWEHLTSQRIFDYAEEFDKDNSAVAPKVLGRDLIAAGHSPGPHFGKMLKQALEVQYADAALSKEEILAQVLA